MLILFDIDGTLANNTHRQHFIASNPKQWDAFFGALVHDVPMLPQISLLHALSACGYTPCFITGRPERYRDDTVAWLATHGMRRGRLYMRQNSDYASSPDFKQRVITHEIGLINVGLAIDDDPRVRAMLAGLRVPCLAPVGP